MWFRKKVTIDEEEWQRFTKAMKEISEQAEKASESMRESGKFLNRAANDIRRAGPNRKLY